MKLFEMFHSNEYLAMVTDVPDEMLVDWYRIGTELVTKEEVVNRHGKAATIHFKRAQLGTTAVCHPVDTEVIALQPVYDGPRNIVWLPYEETRS
jgi:hypothetical protein